MTTTYKLTDEDLRTHCGFQWTLGEWQEAEPGDGKLCSRYWLHSFDDPLVAEWLCCGMVAYDPVRMFECEVGGETKRDGILKRGDKRLRLVREIERPEISLNGRIRGAIYVAQELGDHGEMWGSWARKWLSGEDRSQESSRAAWAAARVAWVAWAADGTVDLPSIIRRAIADEAAHEAAEAAKENAGT